MPFTSLVDIWASRPDLRQAFPQGTQGGTQDNNNLNQWWNTNGVNEYPGVTLVPPGDSRIQPPASLTKEAQAGQSPVASAYQPAGQAPGTPATNQPAVNQPATTGITWNDLEKRGNTIYNKKTGVGYATPEALAKDMGLAQLPNNWQDLITSSSTWTEEIGKHATKEQWDALTPAQQATLEAEYKTGDEQIARGQFIGSQNADTLQKALTRAQTDPYILNKYGDAAIVNQADLKNNLIQLNADYAQKYGPQGTVTEEQEVAQKNLAESEAAAGRAQSGFRQQAQEKLKTEQTGVIQSAQRELQQNVRSQGTAYEKLYGTSALAGVGPITAGGETYSPYGGVAGSVGAIGTGASPGTGQAGQDVTAKQMSIATPNLLTA